MRALTPLCELARKHETDKGGRHYRYGGGDSDTCHEYTPVYWDLFHDRVETVKTVLEIGVNAGSSLRMWEEFFPNARIIGIDSNHGCLFNAGRINCYAADQNNPHDLRNALQAANASSFDMIVDDGSHELEHQITSMKTLLQFMAPDGIYVIEDMHYDCHPELIAAHMPEGFVWEAITCEMGLGKAHCWCPDCGGKAPEQLLVFRRAP